MWRGFFGLPRVRREKIALRRRGAAELLELGEAPARGADDGARNAGELRDLEAVAAVRGAFLYGVQKDDAGPVLDASTCTLATCLNSPASAVRSK